MIQQLLIYTFEQIAMQREIQIVADSQLIVQRITKVGQGNSVRTYCKERLLGKGGFAFCYQVRQLQTKKEYALKILKKQILLKHRAKQKLMNQINIHKTLCHDNIVQFYRVFEDKLSVYILLQLCEQSLGDTIKARRRLTIPQTRYYVSQVIAAVQYLHNFNILHRDLKIGNIFLNITLQVKLGDFGLATKLDFASDKRRSLCGTPNYIAPQVIQAGEGHSFPADHWAIGIITYCLAVGIPPFQTNSIFQTYSRIKSLRYTFPECLQLPADFIDFVRKILVSNIVERYNLVKMKNHPFLNPPQGILRSLPQSSFFFEPNFKKESCQTSKLINFDKRLMSQAKDTSAKQIFLLTQSYVVDWTQFRGGIGFILSNGSYGYAIDKIAYTLDRDSLIEYSNKVAKSYAKGEYPPALLKIKDRIEAAKTTMLVGERKGTQTGIFVKSYMFAKNVHWFRLSNGIIVAGFWDQSSLVLKGKYYFYVYRMKIRKQGVLEVDYKNKNKNDIGAKLDLFYSTLKEVNNLLKAGKNQKQI